MNPPISHRHCPVHGPHCGVHHDPSCADTYAVKCEICQSKQNCPKCKREEEPNGRN